MTTLRPFPRRRFTARNAAARAAATTLAALLAAAPAHAADPDPADADDATETTVKKPAAAKAPARARTRGPTTKWGVEGVLVEAAWLREAAMARQAATLRAQPYVQMPLGNGFEARAGVRLAADAQRGGRADLSQTVADWGDTWLRWRGGDHRITFGAQTVLWGRVDGLSTIDRVARVDLRRFLLDDLKDRRLPQLALRWEATLGEDHKIDAVVLPWFEGARLPPRDGVWSPVRSDRPQILGLEPMPPLAGWFPNASMGRADGERDGGIAVRYTHSGEPLDFGVSAGRTRQPLPYLGLDFAGSRIVASHPMTRWLALDAEKVVGPVTLRTELAYTQDAPMTSASGAGMFRAPAIDWVGAAEFFPGGRDTRVNLQLSTRQVRSDLPTMELKRHTALGGDIESSFGQGQWKVGLRFLAGIGIDDSFISPRIAYTGWEPHEIVLAAWRLRGAAQSFGGFFADHDGVALQFKTKF